MAFSFKVCIITYCLFVVILYSTTVSSQVLKRFDEIVQWAVREEKLYELAKARVKRLKTELNELEKFVDDYEKTTSRHLSGMEDPQLKEVLQTNEGARAVEVASNAMLTYRMTHRLSTMMSRMQRVVLAKDPEGYELKEILGSFTDVNQHPIDTLEPVGETFGKYFEWLPIEDDLEGALDSMVVLYDVYNPGVVDPQNFSAMLSTGTSTPVHIDAYHATKFSLKAFYLGYYANAIDWANYANEKLENERDYSISKELVHYMKEFMGKTHNEEIEKPSNFFPETISFLNFFTEKTTESKTWIKRKSEVQRLNALGLKFPFVEEDTDEEDKSFQLTTSSYYTSCQKARLNQPSNDILQEKSKKLTCSLNRYISPFYYLLPLKVEVLSEFPRILQFHELLLQKELNSVLEELRQKQFSSSYPLNDFPDEYGTRKPHMRMTMDAILDKSFVETRGKSGLLTALARKVEYLTEFQILDSGYGASYPGEKHSDAKIKISEFVGGGYEAIRRKFDDEETRFGGGIQLFLDGPAEGGEIVFEGASTVGKPIKNSAIYWENVGKDGEKPVELLMGSCPVVQGRKLVLSNEFSFTLDKLAKL